LGTIAQYQLLGYDSSERNMKTLGNTTSQERKPSNATMTQKQEGTITASNNILASSNLSITMTLQAQTKSKKRTEYHPLQRPDGVIVLKRPYRPAALSSPPAFKFEKHIPVLHAPASTKHRPTTKLEPSTAAKVRVDDLVGIGAHLTEFGRGGYNDVTDVERGGHADVGEGDLENVLEFIEAFQARRRLTSIQHFLREAASWSVFEMRDG
jgi:hypothetical protein